MYEVLYYKNSTNKSSNNELSLQKIMNIRGIELYK
jgi:hypothetical protein